MNSCKICKNSKLQSLVDIMYSQQHLTYRQIIQNLRALGIPISLGMLSNHFAHKTDELLDSIVIPTVDKILTSEEKDILIDKITSLMVDNLTQEEIEPFLHSVHPLVQKLKELSPILELTTSLSLYTNILAPIAELNNKLPKLVREEYIKNLKNLSIQVPEQLAS